MIIKILIITAFCVFINLFYADKTFAETHYAIKNPIFINPIKVQASKGGLNPNLCEPISLEDAINYALKYYPKIQASKSKYNAAKQNIKVAITAYYPKLNIFSQTNFANNNKLPGIFFPQVGAFPIQGFVPPNSSFTFAGGTWDGSLLNWLVYDFGLRHARVDEAKKETDFAAADETLIRFNVVSAVSNAFFDVILSREMVKIAQANLDEAQSFYKVVSTLVKAGLRPGVDEVITAANLAEAKTKLILAINQGKVADFVFSEAIGLAGQRIPIFPEPFTYPLQQLPADILLSSIRADHPLLEVQNKKIEVIKAKEKVLSKTFLPQISIQGGFNGRGSGYQIGTGGKGRNDGLYPTRLELATALMIDFVPTDVFAAIEKIKREKFNEKAEKANYVLILQKLTGKLGASKALVESAAQMARYTPIQIEAAKMAVLKSTTRYKAGLDNIIEVTTSRRMLYQAQAEDIIARLKLWSALFMISEVQGDYKPFFDLVKAKAGSTP